MDVASIIAGLVIVLVAGDFLVRGSVAVARSLGVPSLIIGLTVVAFGTSAPELVVSIDAAFKEAPGIAIGNVVGSNVANILLVLGASALFRPLSCATPNMGRNIAFVLTASALVVAFAWDGELGRIDGLMLAILLGVYLTYSYRPQEPEAQGDCDDEADKADDATEQDGSASLASGRSLLAWAFVLLGLAGLVGGAHLLVDGSVGVARAFGVSEAVIGLTIVAIGTSLPELTTSLVAAFRGHNDLAVGNVLGSNMFNLLGILGIAALVHPMGVADSFFGLDFWIMLAAAFLVVPYRLSKRPIGRFSGLAFLIAYGAYLVFLASNGGN